MSSEWQNLRSWNGSQNTALEELCCQLARYEQVPPDSTFIRKAPPDAGVECFWKLPSGDEWGWQAKFFLSPPGANQWSQLDDSIRKALEKHPRLTSYTICLPIDRQDPRIDKQQWFMDKWNEHVEKWQGWTKEKNMSVELNYWGEHEIWERLSLEEHRGRHFFWFNKELFSQQWFKDRIAEAIANVGPRYIPELNIELPIARLFDGLGRTSAFYKRVKVLYGKIRRTYLKAHSRKVEESAKDQFDSLKENIGQTLITLEDIEKLETGYINLDSIVKLVSKSEVIAWECIECLENATDEEKEKANILQEQQKQVQEQESYNRPEDFSYERHHLYELSRNLNDLRDFAYQYEAHLANIPALLLVGNGGTGKTHLFCDVAKRRVSSGLPTVLLLGGQFYNEEPWSQIIRLLGLTCSRDEFLGALEAAAQAQGSKALILIDALNEGEGKKIWNKHLAGMLITLSKFPWIGIAISVRTTYEEMVIPDGLVPRRLVRDVHYGFAYHEYQATRTFFDYFGIEHPSVPFLVPEFQNPLFLKLFCQGLKNLGLTKVQSGLKGITAIFIFFIKSVNEKLSGAEYLDYDPKSDVVQKAVEKLAQLMADKRSTWLPREEAQSVVNAFLPCDGYENSLFRHMISEGLLAEDRFRIRDDEWLEGIHFSYERFTDHLIAKYLLDKHLNLVDPSQSFSPDQPLGEFLNDERTCWQNRGLIDAFSIQIPERIQKELVEVAPLCVDFQPVKEAFIESLIWRDPKAISDATLDYINRHIIKDDYAHGQFLNALLTIASNPDHFYNADFLHKNLMKFELAERDAWWSIFLHYQYGEHGAVDRLVDWAWSEEGKSHISDESIRLCGVGLSWFLTTSNRFLRDRATKALVNLFTNRIHVLRQVIQKFLNVNDPYVSEHLFAVAYGCAMRSTENEAISELAKDIYEFIFKNGEPPPDIMLRDYARCVIELALHRGINLEIDIEKVRPSYKSEWSSKIPIEEELKKYREWKEGMPDEEWSRVHLYDSVMGSGDFARYVIGTNSGLFEWLSRRLDEPRKPSRKELYEDFVKSLAKKQRKAWERWRQHEEQMMGIHFRQFLSEIEKEGVSKKEPREEEIESKARNSEQAFRKKLGKKKLKILDELIIPYLNNPNFDRDEYRFDLSIAQRWILQKVLDLGWAVERFGKFDRDLSYGDIGRHANKPERIGKKYQWIAYHEFLARVSDNFEFSGDSWSDSSEKYEGPWQIYSRDIDPSLLLTKKPGDEDWKPSINCWWFPISYNDWDSEPDDVVWLKNSEDLPTIEPLIEVANPKDGSQWFVLESLYQWEQPTSPDEERYEIPRRRLYYLLKSYIVKKSDIDELFEWAKEQNFFGRWMPESRDLYRVFLGEMFWTPGYKYHCTPHHGYEEWTNKGRGTSDIPKEILVTAERYLWEHGNYDCSIDDSVHIYLPCKWLAKHMSLRWNGVEGHFFDEKGNLIALDPSVKAPGPGALLLNRDAIIKFLNDNDYDILWTILGEKYIVSGRMSPENYKGHLEISGVYRIRESKIEGAIDTRFVSRG